MSYIHRKCEEIEPTVLKEKSVIRTEFLFDTTRLHGAYTVLYTTFLTYTGTFLFRSEPLPLDSGYWSRYWPGRKSQIIRSGRSVCSQFQVQILSYFQRDIFYWDKLRRCWHNRKKRWKLPGSNSSSEPEMVLSCHWCGLKMLALVYSPISNFITSYLIVYICGSTTKAKFSFGRLLLPRSQAARNDERNSICWIL